MERVTVGFIGLGLMGKPMARNIMKAGFPLVVHNRSRAPVDELVAEGAFQAGSPAEVAGRVDIVMTNLPDSPDVERVMLGPDGIVEGVHKGVICIDHSTIKPATARMIAEKLRPLGVSCLDAPVSGGDIGAREGTLTVMVGGDMDAMERALPVLQAVGRHITHIGGPGSGQIAKAANQIMVAAQMVALGELLILAKKSGTDPKKVIEAIRGGAAQCWALDHKPDRLFSGNRSPGFKSSMQLKDLGIVLETGREYASPLPATAIHQQLYQAMVSLGFEEQDNSAVIGVFEALAGVGLMDG